MLGLVVVLRAGVSLGLTGRYAMQAREVKAGINLWAADHAVDLLIIDDHGSPSRAVAAYHDLVDAGTEILLGPYGSGTVRRVAPVACGSGRLLWNHGGAADDLAAPLLATVTAPASTYLHSLLALARDAGLEHAVLAPGRGPFAAQVAEGGRQAAETLGMRTRRVSADQADLLVEGASSTRAASLAGVRWSLQGPSRRTLRPCGGSGRPGSRSGFWAASRRASTSSAIGSAGWRTGSWRRLSGAPATIRSTSDRPAQSSFAGSCGASAARPTTCPPKRRPRATWPAKLLHAATVPTRYGVGAPTPCWARSAWTARGARRAMPLWRSNGAAVGGWFGGGGVWASASS